MRAEVNTNVVRAFDAEREARALRRDAQALRRRLKVVEAKALAITKSDRNKLLKVFHPDSEAGVTNEPKAELTEGFQIFSALRIREID